MVARRQPYCLCGAGVRQGAGPCACPGRRRRPPDHQRRPLALATNLVARRPPPCLHRTCRCQTCHHPRHAGKAQRRRLRGRPEDHLGSFLAGRRDRRAQAGRNPPVRCRRIKRGRHPADLRRYQQGERRRWARLDKGRPRNHRPVYARSHQWPARNRPLSLSGEGGGNRQDRAAGAAHQPAGQRIPAGRVARRRLPCLHRQRREQPVL